MYNLGDIVYLHAKIKAREDLMYIQENQIKCIVIGKHYERGLGWFFDVVGEGRYEIFHVWPDEISYKKKRKPRSVKIQEKQNDL